MATFQLVLALPGCRDVLHRQQDQTRGSGCRQNVAGIEQEHFMPDGREIVFHPEVLELRVRGKDLLQELPQGGDVPLPRANLIEYFLGKLVGLSPSAAARKGLALWFSAQPQRQ